MFCGDATTLFDNELATKLDIEDCSLATQSVGHKTHPYFFRGQIEIIRVEEDFENLFIVKAERAQNNGNR
jgi:hypothetical protein